MLREKLSLKLYEIGQFNKILKWLFDTYTFSIYILYLLCLKTWIICISIIIATIWYCKCSAWFISRMSFPLIPSNQPVIACHLNVSKATIITNLRKHCDDSKVAGHNHPPKKRIFFAILILSYYFVVNLVLWLFLTSKYSI